MSNRWNKRDLLRLTRDLLHTVKVAGGIPAGDR